MPFANKNIVPLQEMQEHLIALAEEVCNGQEKIITRNGRAYVALIDAKRLDYYHRLEKQNIHLHLLDEIALGWNDVEQGDLSSVAELKAAYNWNPKS